MPLDSLYWVITHNCNDRCDHCYNSSRPKAVELTTDEAAAVIAHFPAPEDAPLRIILSGGEPLVNRKLLYFCLDTLYQKYGNQVQYMLQTNGDLLTPEILDEILAHHVTRIDIASLDRFHKHKGARADLLKSMMEARGMIFDNEGALISKTRLTKPELTFSMWGANEDFWIGGNWARGRAIQTHVMLHNPLHNFCAIPSGAKGFAGGKDGVMQEVAVQLYNLYPCCPGTRMPIADLRYEDLNTAIARVIRHPMWQALNDGEPFKMGLYKGISEEFARSRTQALGNICLWCDEFFEKYYEDYKPNTSPPHLNLHTFPSEHFVQIQLPNPAPNSP
ncbi:MAG: radical SAM protein [Candidatus Thermochlorobacter sp.]